MSNPVVYLTGAPASGETTVGAELRRLGAAVFAYSDLLRENVAVDRGAVTQ